MDRKEAAQRWAQQKDALEEAEAQRDAAVAQYDASLQREREAWDALQALAGRSVQAPVEAEVTEEEPFDEVRANELVPGTQFHTQPKVRLG
jgi:hypothetical protein